jgi:hypothetical protein
LSYPPIGIPGRTRTYSRLFRREVLHPIELQGYGVDWTGIEPVSLLCKSSVFPLDHQPVFSLQPSAFSLFIWLQGWDSNPHRTALTVQRLTVRPPCRTIAVSTGFEPVISGVTDQRGLRAPLRDQTKIKIGRYLIFNVRMITNHFRCLIVSAGINRCIVTCLTPKTWSA